MKIYAMFFIFISSNDDVNFTAVYYCSRLFRQCSERTVNYSDTSWYVGVSRTDSLLCHL